MLEQTLRAGIKMHKIGDIIDSVGEKFRIIKIDHCKRWINRFGDRCVKLYVQLKKI